MTYIFCSIYQYIFSTKRSYTTIQGVHCTLINILIFLPRKFFIKIEQIAKKNPNQTDPLTDSKWIPCCICFCGVPILQLGMLHPWDLINTPPVNVSSLSGYLEAQQSRVTQYLVAACTCIVYPWKCKVKWKCDNGSMWSRKEGEFAHSPLKINLHSEMSQF